MSLKLVFTQIDVVVKFTQNGLEKYCSMVYKSDLIRPLRAMFK